MTAQLLDKFVRDNFQRLECNRYVRNQYSEERRCECNRDTRWHEDRGIPTDGLPSDLQAWDCDTCCARLPTNAHGRIKFRGFGNVRPGHCPNFIRVQATGVKMEALWSLLTDKDKWALPYPDFVLSLNGGAGNFLGFSRKFAEKLTRAVLNITSGMQKVWIFTHGFNIGAAAQVGQVLEKSSFIGSDVSSICLIGLNAWGHIHNSNMLEDDENYSKGGQALPGELLRRYDYAKGDLDDAQAKMRRLDKNHTHFILVDDGSVGLAGREIGLRTELEKFVVTKMRQVNAATGRNSCIPPVLQICIEGGKYTLLTAERAAQEGTPVITVRGSGRTAEKLAWASDLRAAAAAATAPIESAVRVRVKELVSEYGNISGPQERRSLERALFRFAYQSPEALSADLLGVFDPMTDSDLSRVILDLVFRHRDFKDDLMTQMMLAMAWDRADIAEAKILTDLSEQRLRELNLSRLMSRALMAQQVKFVQLLMKYGVSASDVLNRDRLERLYLKFATQGTQQSERLLARILQFKDTPVVLCGCGQVRNKEELHELLDHSGVSQKDVLLLVDRCLSSLTQDELWGIYTKDNLKDDPSVDPTKVLFPVRFRTGQRKYSLQDLFIWAILCHNMELAETFWRHGKNQIGTALVGFNLLRRMAQDAVANDEMELKAVFEADAKHFEELAVGVLDRCFQRNTCITKALLIRELPMWNGLTALSIGEGSQCLDFMHHSAVQDLLTTVWMGGMSTNTATWAILVCIFLPFLVPSLIFRMHRKFNLVHLHRWRREERARLNQSALSLEQQTNRCQHEMSVLDGPVQAVEKQLSGPEEMATAAVLYSHAESLELSIKNRQQLRMEELYRRKRGILSLPLFATCLKLFYTAPVVKCILNCLATLLFLCVFSYIVLVELDWRCKRSFASAAAAAGQQGNETSTPADAATLWPGGPSGLHWTEWFLFAWIAQFMVEEGRQFSHFRSLRAKLSGMSHWDRFDLLICCMFIACAAFRCAMPAHCDWAQCLYACTLSLFFLRFMQFYYVHHSLGPKVLMIIVMFGDIMFFIAILVVFLLAFGVAAMSLRDESKKLPESMLKNILAMPYWQMYGELSLDTISDEIQASNVRYVMAFVLLAIYMLGTNVLLLNLLIAMFGNTFDRMQSSSYKYWCHIRHDFIKEYYYRPCLPPPLIFVTHFYRFSKFCCKAVRQRCSGMTEARGSDDFVMRLGLTYHQRLLAFEKKVTDSFMRDRDRQRKRREKARSEESESE